jgi:hypothetical protein
LPKKITEKIEETIVGTNVCFPHFENYKFCQENFPKFDGKISTVKKTTFKAKKFFLLSPIFD